MVLGVAPSLGHTRGESQRLGVAVFLGALSKHLGPDHAKVPEILPRLLQRLLDTTSSASVQDAIVKVMPPLMKQNKEKAVETLKQLMETALAPKTDPVTRRGAAMGVGATVKGLNIQAVTQHNILTDIQEACMEFVWGSHVRASLRCAGGSALGSSVGSRSGCGVRGPVRLQGSSARFRSGHFRSSIPDDLAPGFVTLPSDTLCRPSPDAHSS